MFALGHGLNGVGLLGNNGLGVCPIRMLYARPDNLVFGGIRVSYRIDVIALECHPPNQIVRSFAKHVPLDFPVLKLGNRRIIKPHLILHG